MGNHYESIYFNDCTSLSEIGLAFLVMASVSLILNSFPFYTLLNFSSTDSDATVKGFTKTMKIYLLVLVGTEMFACMFVVPLFLVRDLKNLMCWPASLSKLSLESICALSFSSYFAYKIMAMFLTTFTGYSCILYFNQSKRSTESSYFSERNQFMCEAQISLTTTASEQSNQAENTVDKKWQQRNSRKRPILFILMFIIALSVLIPSLPFLGLGPFNLQQTLSQNFSYNSTLNERLLINLSECTLQTFASPKIEKEYIFLFALLMASGGCSLILLYVFVALLLGKLKSQQRIFGEMTQLVSLQGFLFLITWIPLMISLCFAMSGKNVSFKVQSYLTLVTFLNCLTHPFLFGYSLSSVKAGYISIFRSFRFSKKHSLEERTQKDKSTNGEAVRI